MPHPRAFARWSLLGAAVALLALGGTACGSSTESGAAASTSGTDGSTEVLRLGYFPNVTHAPAVYGVQSGLFAKALGGVRLETSAFNAGPEAVEAVFSDAIDATFIGPNPAINAYAKSKGEAIRIVAGTTSGGAALVVKPSITGPAQLKGTTLASPQLGNTQDVALRAWLKEHGLSADTSGGGDVSIKPQSNADTLTAFKDGQIDGAWVPEPWATRLVLEGGGKVLVNEKDLWPGGRFVTTHLIVRTVYLQQHPDAVRKLLEGLVTSVDEVNANPAAAQKAVNDGIEQVTTKPLPDATIQGAWKNLAFTVDPIASSLEKSAQDAESVGLLEPVDLNGIYDLGPLNQILKAAGKAEVKGL